MVNTEIALVKEEEIEGGEKQEEVEVGLSG